MSKKLPWPSDAIMIVCATPEKANRDQMEGVNPCQCRVCGCDLVYDTRTFRRAEELNRETAARISKPLRPIKFFCQPCAAEHDVTLCNIVVDHTAGKDKEYRDQNWGKVQ